VRRITNPSTLFHGVPAVSLAVTMPIPGVGTRPLPMSSGITRLTTSTGMAKPIPAFEPDGENLWPSLPNGDGPSNGRSIAISGPERQLMGLADIDDRHVDRGGACAPLQGG
jgi:hypothetical protein